MNGFYLVKTLSPLLCPRSCPDCVRGAPVDRLLRVCPPGRSKRAAVASCLSALQTSPLSAPLPGGQNGPHDTHLGFSPLTEEELRKLREETNVEMLRQELDRERQRRMELEQKVQEVLKAR